MKTKNKMETLPLISVLLAVNEDNGYLEEAIDSVLTQTYTNFELLILANNCNDSLWSFLLKKADNDVRIKPHRLALGGLCFALNYGINIANGEYIARIDADDVCIDSRLSVQLNYLLDHPKIDLVGTHVLYIDNEGQELKRECFLPKTHDDIVKVLPWKSPIIHPSILAKRNFFLGLGGYKIGFYGEDYDLWIRGWKSGYKYCNLENKLLKYRSHSKQASSHSYSKKQAVSIKTVLYYHNKLEQKLTTKIKFIFGILIQSKVFFYLIHSTSLFRNKLKSKFKK